MIYKHIQRHTLICECMYMNGMSNKTNEINESQVREIILWSESTEQLYNMYNAITENYIKKIKKGIFNEELAVKGLLNLVRETMSDYNRHFDSDVTELRRVNAATKEAAARRILMGMKEDIEYSMKEVSA